MIHKSWKAASYGHFKAAEVLTVPRNKQNTSFCIRTMSSSTPVAFTEHFVTCFESCAWSGLVGDKTNLRQMKSSVDFEESLSEVFTNHAI